MGIQSAVLQGVREGEVGSEGMTEHVAGDQWGSYWHVNPDLLEASGYKEEVMRRLRREARNDLKEGGKYQVFSHYVWEEA